MGSSAPCLALFLDCPDSNGYVFVAARQLRALGHTVTVRNLGIPAAVISPGFQALGQQHGHLEIQANFIDQEAPFVQTDATLVTIFAGANEVNVITGALGQGAGGSDPVAFIDQQIQAFRADYQTLIERIRGRTQTARIIVLNLPNVGAMPFLAGASLAQRQAAQRAAVGMTTTAINPLVSQGVIVIDLMCDAGMYDRAIYSNDGFHPSDAGYSRLADAVVQAARSSSFPRPQGSCAQMTLIP